MKNIHTELKLPKQWKRWFKKAGLKDTYGSSLSRRYGQAYFKGHGRNWRIDATGNLDMSEPFATFDRWANSLESSVPMTAKTEKEFYNLVMGLLPAWERLMFEGRRRIREICARGRDSYPHPTLMSKRSLNEIFGRMGSSDSFLKTLRSIPAERSEAPAQIGVARYDDSELFHPLTDEAEQASRSNMRVLKGRPKGEITVVACGVGKGRSFFYSNPVPEHLKGLVVLPPVYRGEPGPSLEERLEDLTMAMGNEHVIHAEANCLQKIADLPLDATTMGQTVREWVKP
uniref:Uncharacterized protein n=1 Tax=Pseudomonas phage Cygsa01 TaxID=3138529 RepID=A0AAU6W3L0_9VIRU